MYILVYCGTVVVEMGAYNTCTYMYNHVCDLFHLFLSQPPLQPMGMYLSQVLKIFVDNPFPINLMKQQSPVRCLDLSARYVHVHTLTECYIHAHTYIHAEFYSFAIYADSFLLCFRFL